MLYLLKELTHRKGRTLTNLLVLAALVAIFVVLASVINSYSEAIYLPFQSVGVDMTVHKSAVQSNDTPTNAIRLPFGSALFSQDEINAIASAPHIKDVSKTLILWRFDKGEFTSIEGLEPASSIGRKYRSWIVSGSFIEPGEEHKAVVEKHFAKFYGLSIGDSLLLGSSPFEIIGILSAQEQSQVSAANLYINLSDAQMLIDTKGFSQLYITLDAISSDSAVRSEISQINPDAVVVSGSSIAASLGNVIEIYQKFRFLILGIIGIILTLILVQVNTTSLMERRKDIGVLQTVGWTKANISRQIVSEILVQTIFGFILGIIVSILIIIGIGSINVQAQVSQSLGNNLSTLTAPLVPSIAAIIQFLILTLGISIIVSFFLSRQLARMKPVNNLRNNST